MGNMFKQDNNPKCPRCGKRAGFRFLHNLPNDKTQYYPNECNNCGCMCNYRYEYIIPEGAKIPVGLIERRTNEHIRGF